MAEALILYETQPLDFVIIKIISLDLINDTDLPTQAIYPYKTQMVNISNYKNTI